MGEPVNRFVRRIPTKQQRRDSLGFRLCLVCESRVPKGRRSYCSEDCYVRNTPSIIAVRVVRRDNRTCVLCGKRGWEADHIVPVCEGGGLCGLDGYRTLCTPCHKEQTAMLAARRAAARRARSATPSAEAA